MTESGKGEIPISIIDKVTPGLHGSKLADKAIKVAQLDGNLIDKNSKQGRLQALLGDQLYGWSKEGNPDLSLYGKIFNNPDEEDRQARIKKYKEELLYYTVLIDKDDLPQSYFALQARIARERGQAGLFDDSPEARKLEAEILYNDQKKSLDSWVDYLTDKDANYPTWFKYYVLTSVTRIGNYDKEKREFGKRNKETVGIFPDLNREALSYTYDTLSKYYLKGEDSDQEDLQRILETANFSKIYSFAINKVTPDSKENKEKTEGEWAKFNQGSDPTALYESLQGHGTGWCTAGEETAKIQLKTGDFYVYYTKDQDGQHTIPRIAIRTKQGVVAEVRGVEANQNMEANMIDIAKEKYHQLPGGKKFDKKDADMKFLTLLDKKVKDNQPLTKEDLRFLYEFDGTIEGFGYEKDPRIEEIISKRNIKADLSFVFNCPSNQISITQEEALTGDIKFHYGELDLSRLTSTEGLTLPEIIRGSLNLSRLTSTEGLTLPETINGDLFLNSLTSTEGLTLPETINGNLFLIGLTLAENLTFPETIGGGLDLGGLTSAQGLTLPKTINGGLYLTSLTSAENLTLPETIGGSLDLNSLTSIESLTLPKTINGYLDLRDLVSAENLILPETINGNLYLGNLTSAQGLTLPKTINGYLVLSNLTSAQGLTLPKTINGNLLLSSLVSIENLTMPETINGYLDLRDLASAENLTMPETINGSLYLSNFTSAQGLTLPKTINGDLYLSSLTSTEGLTMSETIKGNLDLSSLPLSKKQLLREKYPKFNII